MARSMLAQSGLLVQDGAVAISIDKRFPGVIGGDVRDLSGVHSTEVVCIVWE